MDLRYINTFHTIVEAGGFNKAAEKLCYTQSTITFHVSQLEKELGVQLFEKAGRHMVLTKAGQELVPYVENVLQSVNNMKSFRSVFAVLLKSAREIYVLLRRNRFCASICRRFCANFVSRRRVCTFTLTL